MILIIFIALFILAGFIPEPKHKCEICKDTKEVEILVMGTDTDFVECQYCKNNYKK